MVTDRKPETFIKPFVKVHPHETPKGVANAGHSCSVQPRPRVGEVKIR